MTKNLHLVIVPCISQRRKFINRDWITVRETDYRIRLIETGSKIIRRRTLRRENKIKKPNLTDLI